MKSKEPTHDQHITIGFVGILAISKDFEGRLETVKKLLSILVQNKGTIDQGIVGFELASGSSC